MSTVTEVLPEIDVEESTPDGKSHYVRIKALMLGGVVVALCGKKYIPTKIAGAELLPICAKCKELMGFLEMMEQANG